MANRASAFLIFGITCVLLACKSSGGSGGEAHATVTCEGKTETIDCEVKHVSGAQGINVCWDLRFGCQNGTSVTGQNFCQSVQPGATSQKRIPLTQLANFAQCDKATSTQVENLKLSAL